MDRQTSLNIKLKAIAVIAPFLFLAGCSLGFFTQDLVRSGCQSALAVQLCKYASMTFIVAAIPLELLAVSLMFAMNKKSLKILNYTLIAIALLAPLLFCIGVSCLLVEKGLLAWIAGFCCTIPGPTGATAVLIFLIVNFKRFRKAVSWLSLLSLSVLFLVNIFCFFPIHRYAISHCGVLNTIFQFAVGRCQMMMSLVGILP